MRKPYSGTAARGSFTNGVGYSAEPVGILSSQSSHSASLSPFAALLTQFRFHLAERRGDPVEDFIEVVPGRAQWW